MRLQVLDVGCGYGCSVGDGDVDAHAADGSDIHSSADDADGAEPGRAAGAPLNATTWTKLRTLCYSSVDKTAPPLKNSLLPPS